MNEKPDELTKEEKLAVIHGIANLSDTFCEAAKDLVYRSNKAAEFDSKVTEEEMQEQLGSALSAVEYALSNRWEDQMHAAWYEAKSNEVFIGATRHVLSDEELINIIPAEMVTQKTLERLDFLELKIMADLVKKALDKKPAPPSP